MKKRVLSMILTAAMCLGTTGSTVGAATADFGSEIQAEAEETQETDTEIALEDNEDVSEENEVESPSADFDDGFGEGTPVSAGDTENLTDISDYQVDLEEGPYFYEGKAVEPEVLDVYPKEESEDDTGEITYDVAYENNEKPGTATVVITGNGNFTGVIRKEFTIEKGIQDIELEDITLTVEEETQIDLSGLIGTVTVAASEEGYVEISEDADKEGTYVIRTLKNGKVTLHIQATGDEYYDSFDLEVEIFISKADHHHTYLQQDKNGNYTVYDSSKAQTVDATCQEPAYTLYKCEDPECGYEEKITDPEGELADHSWGPHMASTDKSPTYEEAGSLIHICQVCGAEEELEEDEWDPDDYKLVQKLKNDQGTIAAGEIRTLTLDTYNDSEYGQYLSFTPQENEAYQIDLKVLEGDEFTGVFARDDVNLTEMSSAETLEAEKTYYICVQGSGKCEVSVSKVQKQTDISDYEVILDFDPSVPFEADGSAIEPDIREIVQKYDDEEITYNISYRNNKEPGTAQMIIAGSGRYKGQIVREFQIIKGNQVLEQEDISLKENETEDLDLTELTGKITVTPSREGIVRITQTEDKIYTVTALKAGGLSLKIQAAGDVYFNSFEKTVNVIVTSPGHHHSYLTQDASGEYTVYKVEEGTFHKATCTAPSYTVYKCTDPECGFEEKITDSEDTITDHNLKEEVVEPTCTSEGYTRQICKDCGYTTIKEGSDVEKLDHRFIFVRTVDATEDSRAYNLYQCAVCSIQQREYFGCIQGQHTFETRVVAPTCTKEGYTRKECSVCGYSETTDEVSALGHDMKDTVYEATEEQYGYTRSQCARCGYYEDTITSCKIRLDEKGNKVSVHEGVAVEDSESQSDCTRPGTRKYKCKICKKTYEVEIPEILPAKEHTWEINVGDEATCEETGTKTCSVCGAREEIPALGHNMVEDPENSQEASYDEKGIKAYKCSNPDCEETNEVYTQRKHQDGPAVLTVGTKSVSVKESSLLPGSEGLYFKFTPTATKVYYVEGGDEFYTSFCKNDDDLTNLTDTAELIAGETYYVYIVGDGTSKVTISNVTDFINIQKEKYQIVIMDDPDTLVYSGDEVELSSLMIKMQNNSMMSVPENWTVKYDNNVNAGTATVTVTGGGKYKGTLTKEFTIRKASQGIEETSFSLKVNESKDLDWELAGDEITVKSDSDKLAVLKTDQGYKIFGQKSGKANLIVHVSGNANYEALDITIPVNISEEEHIHGFADENGELDENKILAVLDGSENPEIRVELVSGNCEDGNLYNVTCLKEGCGQYTTQYLDTRNIEEHTFDEGVIVVQPTYETLGKRELTCTKCGSTMTEDVEALERTDLGDLVAELSRSVYIYDGKEKKPSIKVLDDNDKAISSKLYNVAYKNNKNPGDNTAAVIITPKSDAYCGSLTATFTIAQAKMSPATVTVGGKSKLTVKGARTIADYEVSKKGIITFNRKTGVITAGKKLGKVKLTVYGYDKEYNDVTISVTVSVVPKGTSISKVKSPAKKQAVISWKANKTGGGYQIQYSTDKNFKKGVKTVKVTSYKKTSVTVKSLKSKKNYYFRIRTINSKSASLVSGWSKAKKLKIK